jgi:hypothetical protein
MAIDTSATLPAIRMVSKEFKDGYADGQVGTHCGWNISRSPREETIIDFLYNAVHIIEQDGYDAEEIAFIAGLLSGWLRRSD